MKVEELVEVGTELERVDSMDVLFCQEKVFEKVKNEVVVFTNAHFREYCKPFMRFSTPCGMEGNRAWDAKHNLSYYDSYMSDDMLNTLGFMQLDYGKYRRKMVKDVLVEIHGYDFHTDFVVVDYVNEGEPLIVFSRSFLVTSKSQVDFRLGEMRIDITMLKEDKDVDTLLENLVEDMVEVGNTRGVLDIPVDKELPLLLCRPFLSTCGALIDMGRETMTIDDGVIKHTYYPKTRAKAYLESFKIDEDEDWLGCFEVGRDEDGNPKYNPVAPSLLDIKDEMERALAMEAYFNPFKNIIVFKKLIDFLVILGLYELSDLKHRLYNIYFNRLEINDKGFDHIEYWNRIRELTTGNKRATTIKNPLIIKENSEISGGHYVTKIAKALGYYVNEDLDKCLDPIESEEWNHKMFVKELDRANLRLRRLVLMQQPPRVGNKQRNESSG
ncbi:hypothetical protein Tco_1359297 [Tanacetum coccineum]